MTGTNFHEDRFFLVVANKPPLKAVGVTRDGQIEAVRFFPLNALPTGEEPGSLRAKMAVAQRIKLRKLLLSCSSKIDLGIDDSAIKVFLG